MKNLLYIVVCVLAAACCPCRNAGVTHSVNEVERLRDSVYVHHYDTIRVVERDTLWLAPINQWHESVSLKASHSYLENEYCTTTASVSELGILTHRLDTRPSAMLPVRLVEISKVERDSAYISQASEVESTTASAQIIERKVKKPLSWFVKTQITGFWIFVAIALIKYGKVIIKFVSGWRI